MTMSQTSGEDDRNAFLRRAIRGESLTVDSRAYSLHELTQIAVALRDGAALSILNTEAMSPIERASIASAGRGRIVFA